MLRFAFPPDGQEGARTKMVRDQIEIRGVRNERVLAAMRAVPRHLFCPAADAASAYHDHPLPIGEGQTISQPFIVAYMTEALEIGSADSVLEIGTGSGYQTAVLACLADRVYSLERKPELANAARIRLTELGVDNVEVRVADGTPGWSERGPFDKILVTAGTPAVPPPLLDQLAGGGMLLAPVGGRSVQDLELWTRTAEGLGKRSLIPVVFVPLIGEHGWADE